MGEPTAKIRFPTVEVFGIRSGNFLSTTERKLVPPERQLALSIFGQSIDLDAVRVVMSPIVNAPTTLGNYIRIGQSGLPDWVLIHELTHIWQFQNKGSAYISDSAWHQTKAWITSGSRNAAYSPSIIPGKSIHEYTAEHQAVIVEGYFLTRSGGQTPGADVQRMIDEVRSCRPLAANVRMSLSLDEAAFGADAYTRTLIPKGCCDGVPLLRIEF